MVSQSHQQITPLASTQKVSLPVGEVRPGLRHAGVTLGGQPSSLASYRARHRPAESGRQRGQVVCHNLQPLRPALRVRVQF